MSKDTFDFFYGTGFNIVNNYGATETSIPTIGTYGKHVYADTCGKPYPDIKVKIDRSGELLIKSPYMMIGYYGDKKPTDEAFNPDGWFKSGDLARFDKHKNIVILGRCKENIVLSTGKKPPLTISNRSIGASRALTSLWSAECLRKREAMTRCTPLWSVLRISVSRRKKS